MFYTGNKASYIHLVSKHLDTLLVLIGVLKFINNNPWLLILSNKKSPFKITINHQYYPFCIKKTYLEYHPFFYFSNFICIIYNKINLHLVNNSHHPTSEPLFKYLLTVDLCNLNTSLILLFTIPHFTSCFNN